MGLDIYIKDKEGSQYQFKAGSYSWYNVWREKLSMMVHGKDPHAIWSLMSGPEAAEWKEKPFVAQINFSDCEGEHSNVICKKLAQDYEGFICDAIKFSQANDDPSFLDYYRMWMATYREAADHGGTVEYA